MNFLLRIVGSSPRVWGKLVAPDIEIDGDRVIPTGVGKAEILYSYPSLSSGHPHGCGESIYAPDA